MSKELVVYVDEDLEDLMPDFMENRHQDITVIGELLGRGEYKEIQRIGHSMKGSGGGYGFDEITRIGKDLEIAAKNNDQSEVARLVGILSEYLSKVKVVYHEVD